MGAVHPVPGGFTELSDSLHAGGRGIRFTRHPDVGVAPSRLGHAADQRAASILSVWTIRAP